MGCVFGDINSRAETPTSNLNLIENSTATRYVCQYSKRDGGKRFDFKIRIVSFDVLSNLLNFLNASLQRSCLLDNALLLPTTKSHAYRQPRHARSYRSTSWWEDFAIRQMDAFHQSRGYTLRPLCCTI